MRIRHKTQTVERSPGRPKAAATASPLGVLALSPPPFVPITLTPDVSSGGGGGGRAARPGEQLLRGGGNGRCPPPGKPRSLLLLRRESKEHVGRTWGAGPAPRRARGPCPCPAHSFSPCPPAPSPHLGRQFTFPITGPQLGRALPPPRGYFSGSKCPGNATGISCPGQETQKVPSYLGRYGPSSSRSSFRNSSRPPQAAQPGFCTCRALCQEGLPSVPAGTPCVRREGAWTSSPLQLGATAGPGRGTRLTLARGGCLPGPGPFSWEVGRGKGGAFTKTTTTRSFPVGHGVGSEATDGTRKAFPRKSSTSH